MKKILRIMLTAFAAAFVLASCQPKEQKIHVVSTNDMHANIDNFPQLAGLIDSLRSVYPDLLLFGAGDNRSGNPINDRYEEVSKPMYELMNAVGFDLSAFGNHEWDGGPIALRNVLTWAKFPFVCANVTFDDTLQMPNCKPYETFERDGLKIGVIGGIQLGLNGLPDFHPKNANGSHFVPFEEVLPQYLDTLKDCNAIFLLTHLGHEEDREVAAKFPQVAAIFGGHSHTRVGETGKVMVNGVWSRKPKQKSNM
jgi:2',3'-cyclic-nucleotide 2'-phosphodiesterase (5'-nucleotidase family)